MSRIPLCKDDPLLTTLRDVFDATPLRVPEQRVQPGCVVAARRRDARFLGRIDPLLDATGDAAVFAGAVRSSKAVALSGQRSRAVDLDVGAKLLSGLLPALDVSVPDVHAALASSRRISLSFDDVTRRYLEAAEVGRILKDRRLDFTNPTARLFEDDGYRLLLIDSAFISRGFTVEAKLKSSRSGKADAGFGPPGEVLSAGVSVSTASASALTFEGPAPMTFAFSCVRLIVGDDGALVALKPDPGPPSLGFGREGPEDADFQREILTDADELLDWSSTA